VIMRRTIALAFISFICLPGAALAQAAYPTRPITIIVPYPPGGNLDVITRLISPSMSQSLGQTIVVDNKPGAGGLIGHAFTARATADGYTILTTANGSLAYAPKLQPQPPFKATDFAALGSIAETPMVLEVNANGRFKSVADFVAYAKEHPGQVTIGHSGNGTTNHVAILLLEQAAHVKFNIVPYKGSAPAVTDLLHVPHLPRRAGGWPGSKETVGIRAAAGHHPKVAARWNIAARRPLTPILPLGPCGKIPLARHFRVTPIGCGRSYRP